MYTLNIFCFFLFNIIMLTTFYNHTPRLHISFINLLVIHLHILKHIVRTNCSDTMYIIEYVLICMCRYMHVENSHTNTHHIQAYNLFDHLYNNRFVYILYIPACVPAVAVSPLSVLYLSFRRRIICCWKHTADKRYTERSVQYT